MSARTYLVTLALAVTATAAFTTTGVLTAAGTEEKRRVTTHAAAPKAMSQATGTCNGGNTYVVVTKLARPADQWLTATTASGRNLCNADSAPLLGFEHA